MLAVRAARMFDGIGPDLVRDPVVLVEDGRFVEVFAGGEPPGGAEPFDLGDATLLPGLIDTHSHLAFDASGDVVGHLDGLSNEALLDEMRLAARATLASGVTTMRDLGDRDYLALRIREETAADPHAGPTVLAAGPPITTTRGHCWFLGGEADGIDAVRAAVRERAERGVDVVKVMASGGGLTPGSGLHLRQYDPAAAAGHGGRGQPARAADHRFGYSVADMVTLAGLTPMEALRSATSLAARVCGVADRKGTIAVGRDADLVAVAGDPLADITAVCEVTAVIHAGRVTHRPQPAPARGRSR